MKKIKAYVLGLLLAVTMISVSACGNSSSTNESQSSGGANGSTTSETTTAAESSSSTSKETMNGSGEESTGVIDGVINDVEKGVNDITGNGTTESGAGSGSETTQASDR